MTYLQRIFSALNGNFRRQVRIALGRKARPAVPVLSQPLEAIVERHAWICKCLGDYWPVGLDITGRRVCEVGAGDCLAAAGFVLAHGKAEHVVLVEREPAVVNSKQREVLAALAAQGIAMQQDIITPGNPPALNPNRATYCMAYMEECPLPPEHAFLYSICVGEHVEDLARFFASCHAALSPGGGMWHYIDLGGHGVFEDPLPPLEFQRVPDWLFAAMYPHYHRATRRFVEDYVTAAKTAGFVEVTTKAVRRADPTYMASVRPKLRAAARRRTDEELGTIEFILSARKAA